MNNKLSKWLVTITLLFLLMFWFLQNKDSRQKPLPINTISATKSLSTATPPKIITNDSEVPTQSDDGLNQQSKLGPENGQEMSYIALYRLSRLWRTCDRIVDYNNQDDWFDAAAYLTTQLQHQNEEFSKAPPTSQVDALQKHADSCIDWQQKLANMDLPDLKSDRFLSEPNRTAKHLMQLLSIYKTTTDKESLLADVIKLSILWVEKFETVLQLSKGNDNSNAAAIQIMQDELKQLRIQQHNLLRKNTANENVEPASDGFMEIFMVIEAKEQAIQDLMVVDQNLRNQAIADFSKVNDQMFASLKSRDPDVFYEAQVTLETNKTLSYYGFFPHKSIGMRDLKQPFSEYVFPEDVLMQALGLNNPDWFRLVVPFATQLYVCELGADCGPNSEWVKHHCFKTSGEFNPVSCDLDLPTFYQEHLLSQNHFDDVQTVLNVMRDLYAK